jgi:mRNA interferase MazF
MKEVKKWHIYSANLDPTVGSEQGKIRPVLVISEDDINNLLNCVNIIPITTRQANRFIYPNEVLLPENTSGLPKESIALCHQIRTIDKRRLISAYGKIEISSIKNGIYDAITFQLGFSYY